MKKGLFDTSTLVAALVESHPKHTLVLPWLQRVKKGFDKGVVSFISVSEFPKPQKESRWMGSASIRLIP